MSLLDVCRLIFMGVLVLVFKFLVEEEGEEVLLE